MIGKFERIGEFVEPERNDRVPVRVFRLEVKEVCKS